MGIERHTRTTIFRCEICPAEHIERHGATWDEARTAVAMAKNIGWRFSKRRGGAWEALCPDCAVGGYSLQLEEILK